VPTNALKAARLRPLAIRYTIATAVTITHNQGRRPIDVSSTLAGRCRIVASNLSTTGCNCRPTSASMAQTCPAHNGMGLDVQRRVRMAQYISMYPADENNSQLREIRLQSWRDREPPKGFAFPGDPGEWEKKRYPRAVLSELGESLLGLRPWNRQ
jgi:hypothetical protein